ncbi:hypothetical protein N7G274_007414 [Stereocaulon virgatum]|uniref:Uncharacterized protein n=1 Tax=Stereocaulon virgatum TaxID=373712 RepID=A0ABR4A516_9LECA
MRKSSNLLGELSAYYAAGSYGPTIARPTSPTSAESSTLTASVTSSSLSQSSVSLSQSSVSLSQSSVSLSQSSVSLREATSQTSIVATPPASPLPFSPPSAGLTVGAKAAIGVGSINALVAAGGIIYFLLQRKRKKRQDKPGSENIRASPGGATQGHSPELTGPSRRMEMHATPRAPPELPQDHTVGPELRGHLAAVELDVVPPSPRS